MPQQPKFKKGDRLKWVNPQYKTEERKDWQDCLVTQVDNDCSNGRIGYYIRNSTNQHGLLYEFEVELATPDLTPQELADKYRALRAEAQAISKTLQDMGYQPEFKTIDTNWTKMISGKDQTYRFVNVVTTIL